LNVYSYLDSHENIPPILKGSISAISTVGFISGEVENHGVPSKLYEKEG
jgi:hypothetical protein